MWDVIFPENIECIFCKMPIAKENKYSICRNCFEKIEFIEEICKTCGRSGKNSSLCTYCYSERYYYDEVYSVLKYNDFMHKIMYEYKYGYKNYLSLYFANMSESFICTNGIEYDYITSVPISQKRMKKRGFNQSQIIAEKIFKGDGKYVELFNRVKHTKFLSKLSNIERVNEIKGAFEINQTALDSIISNSYNKDEIRLIIFDDILTTGATLNELSKIAKQSIINLKVIAFTLCNAKNIDKYSSENEKAKNL